MFHDSEYSVDLASLAFLLYSKSNHSKNFDEMKTH